MVVLLSLLNAYYSSVFFGRACDMVIVQICLDVGQMMSTKSSTMIAADFQRSTTLKQYACIASFQVLTFLDDMRPLLGFKSS